MLPINEVIAVFLFCIVYNIWKTLHNLIFLTYFTNMPESAIYRDFSSLESIIYLVPLLYFWKMSYNQQIFMFLLWNV